MPAERPLGGVGERLRDARERRGVSLREIATTTRISVRALEALERNDISRLPGGIFSRAFVRAYAHEVGLDPESVVKDFISEFPDDSVTAGHPTASLSEERVEMAAERQIAGTIWLLLLVSIPVVALVLYFATPREQAGSAGTALTPAPAAVPAQAPPPPETAPPVAPPAVRSTEPAAPATLRVDLLATARCWVSATVDGQRLFSRELQAGERQMLQVAREATLSVGDAGALAMTLNGAEARALGRAGQVVTVRLSPATYQEWLAAP